MRLAARWSKVGIALMALGGAASACGGSTSGGSARRELEEHGSARCAAACETVARCDLTRDDCSCGCSSDDPAGCVCDCEEPTVAGCVDGCSEQVAEVLADAPGCEDEMLGLLQCFDGAVCAEDPCKPEQDRLEDCRDEAENIDDSSPAVACSGGSRGVGSEGPEQSSCSRGWSSCSDGNSYAVECTTWSDGAQECRCLMNGVDVGAAASLDLCDAEEDVASASCGWSL